MWPKLYRPLVAVAVLIGVVLSPGMSQRVNAQLATFDGANFTLNQTRNAQQISALKQQAQQLVYEYQAALSSVSDLKSFSWTDLQSSLTNLENLLHKDETVCTDLQYNSQYFATKFPTFQGSNVCDSGNLTQAHNNINNARNVMQTLAKQRQAASAAHNTTMQQMAATTGELQAIKQQGLISGEIFNATQSQGEALATLANQEASYFDTQLARNAKDDAEASAARALGNFMRTGCYNDPTKPVTPCVKTLPATPPPDPN